MIYDELVRRHVDPNVVTVWIDYDNNLATFPLYGIMTNRFLGYQQYRPLSSDKKSNDPALSRYTTYHSGYRLNGEDAVWGLDCVSSQGGTLFLTEGIFEAARLNGLGYNAVAILCSCPPKRLIQQLYSVGWDRLVWCGDNDEAGRKSKVIKMVDDVMFFDVDLDDVGEDILLQKIIENERKNQKWLRLVQLYVLTQTWE